MKLNDNGKGDAPRQGSDSDAYAKTWDKIFNKENNMQTRKELENVLRGNWELHYAMLEEHPGDRDAAVKDVFAALLMEGIVSNEDLPTFLEIINRNYPGEN